MAEQFLQAGTAVTDITPPLEVGMLRSAVDGLYGPFESVRLPLKARVLALKSGETSTVIVALDLLALSDTSVGGWASFKKALMEETPATRLIITCTHTHSAPESVALSDLYQTTPFKNWLNPITTKIREAVREATDRALPCRVMYGEGILEGYNLQRRVPSPSGILMSDGLQPIAPELLRREPVDRRVKTVQFIADNGQRIATVVHAVCHPVHEMCLPHISADFPGELCQLLDEDGRYGTAFFFNGAAGDINPPTVSCGAEAAHAHADALAGVLQKELAFEPVAALAHVYLQVNELLGCRTGMELANVEDSRARIQAVALSGDLVLLFLPGEPFVEIGLSIEKYSPFAHTLVCGFAENTIGYIPTTQAFSEGGYEAGPGKWSFLPRGTDKHVTQIALGVLESLKGKIMTA